MLTRMIMLCATAFLGLAASNKTAADEPNIKVSRIIYGDGVTDIEKAM